MNTFTSLPSTLMKRTASSLVLSALCLGTNPAMAAEIERISVAADGTEGNGYSTNATISGDGNVIAFWSRATNLVPGDSNNDYDAFVYDRTTNTVEQISVDIGGSLGQSSSTPYVSAGGEFVVFSSSSSRIVPNDVNGVDDVFFHDRTTGITERISTTFDGSELNDRATYPTVSADGRYVAYVSRATNIVAGDTNETADVFLYDRALQTTTRQSVATDGTQGDAQSTSPRLSANGQIIVFGSQSTTFGPNNANGGFGIFVRDIANETTDLVSKSATGEPGNGWDLTPRISGNGRFVSWSSRSSNLVAEDTNTVQDMLVHDRDTGITELISIGTGGVIPNNISVGGNVADDGRFATFYTSADNLVENDNNGVADVFVRDRDTGKTFLISNNTTGGVGNSFSSGGRLSDDGKFISFDASATDLVDNDTNNTRDVFFSAVIPPSDPPLANAGPDQIAMVGSVVTLDGSASSDPENDTLSFTWDFSSVPAGSTTEIGSAFSEIASLPLDVVGTFNVTLNVNDGTNPDVSDNVEITSVSASDYAVMKLQCASDIVSGLDSSQVTSTNNQNTMIGYIDDAISLIAQGKNSRAIRRINKALARTDGCSANGSPDTNGKSKDWITSCSVQVEVEACLLDAKSAL